MDNHDDSVDLTDPEYIRFVSYLAAAGSTWRDPETHELKTYIRSQFRPIVYPLLKKFYPNSKVSIIAVNKEVSDKTFYTDIAFRIEDSILLQSIEDSGFLLGSKRRRPSAQVVNDAELFKIYLRVLWEVHGDVRVNKPPPRVHFVQRFPQELQQLTSIFTLMDISCMLIHDGKDFRLEIEGPEAIRKFFDVIDWEVDSDYGRQKLEIVRELLKRCQ